MNKWWYRTPIILFCAAIVFTTFFIGKVALAASGMPEFGEILAEGLKAFRAYLDWLLEVLKFIW